MITNDMLMRLVTVPTLKLSILINKSVVYGHSIVVNIAKYCIISKIKNKNPVRLCLVVF